MTRRWRPTLGRPAKVAALVLLGAPLLAPGAWSQEQARVPDEFQGVASAAGISVVSFKDPNPLPVGPGAFLTFESPEVEGGLSANRSTARASVLYPGPAIAGGAALMCTAGAEPFCGQAPPPVLVEAEHPQRPDATLASDGISMRDPAAPVSTGAGRGEAHVTAQSTTSTAQLAAYRVAPPDASRKAILDALAATVDAIPGAKRANDLSLLSFDGGTVVQRIEPAGDGKIRAEAESVVNGVRMVAGLVTIDSVKVTSFVVADGLEVHEAGSSTSASGVLVGGFPASIGPEGILLDGQGDGGQGRQALNGVAGRVADAFGMAVEKLDIEVRDGAASHTEDGTSAAADGLRLSVRNARLTDASPPQVPALCSVTGAIQDPLSSGGLSLPPLCAVPDATGTSDRYEFQLGRSASFLTAQLFPDYADGVLDTTGDGGGDVVDGAGAIAGAAGGDGTTGAGGSGGAGTAGSVGGGRSPTGRGVPDISDVSFLAFEAHWLGDAADGFGDVYLALACTAVFLLVLSKLLLRAVRSPALTPGEPTR